jgi:thiol-disulfide isomerase/thioredoxin
MKLALARMALVCFAASSLALTACGGGALPPSAPSALLAQALPDFKRPTLAGPMIDTAAARGQVVVVKFFAKYCEPCKRTLPAAEALHQQHPEVVFIGVAEDERSSDVSEVVDAYHLSFPIVHDVSNVLSGRYRVSDMPATFVADAGGKIVWVGGPENTESGLPIAIDAAK